MELGISKNVYNKTNKANRFIFLVLLAFLVSFSMLSYQIYQFVVLDKRTAEQSMEQEQQSTKNAAARMNVLSQELVQMAETLASDLTEQKLPYTDIEARLQTDMGRNKMANALGVAFDPYMFDPDIRLHSPYLVRTEEGTNNFEWTNLHQSRDYSDPKSNTEWYMNAVTRGGTWAEPRFGNTSKKMVAFYSTPFYKIDPATKQKKIAGVVLTNFSLEQLKEILRESDYGTTGYSFLLSRYGIFIAHPIDEYVSSQKRVYSLVNELDQSFWKQIGDAAAQGLSGSIDVPAIDGKQNDSGGDGRTHTSQIYYEPIPTSGWLLGTVYTQQQDRINEATLRHNSMQVLICGLITLLLLAVLLVRPDRNNRKRQWIMVGIVSALLASGIVIVWYLVLHAPYQNTDTTQLSRRTDVDAYLKQKTNVTKTGTPTLIPTGVHIQTMEISGTNTINVNGYVWQKIRNTMPAGIQKGVTFPEATSVSFADSYKREEKDGLVIGQTFKATFKANFQFNEYPFDKNAVNLRMLPKDFDKNVVLVPDLESYTTLYPNAKPGLENNLRLPGWRVDSSYFSYVKNSYNDNFGIKEYQGQNNFPELNFTVTVQRDFLNPFISNLLPVFVIITILFALLLMITGIKKFMDIFGFKTSGIIGSCSALFFSILLAHSKLRSDLAVSQITYLEYFYFVAYAAILLIAVNAYVFSKYQLGKSEEDQSDENSAKEGRFIRMVRYEDNLIAKMYYWPTILTIMLITTIAVFY